MQFFKCYGLYIQADLSLILASNLIVPWISPRCFFKDGSSSIPCMKFRMITHMQGSTVSNFKFQCMTVHFSLNKVIFYKFWKCLLLRQIKCTCGEFYCTTLFKTNLQLKHIEFLADGKEFLVENCQLHLANYNHRERTITCYFMNVSRGI